MNLNFYVCIQIKGMHTLIRDVGTSNHDFVFYSDRLIRLVNKFCLNRSNVENCS